MKNIIFYEYMLKKNITEVSARKYHGGINFIDECINGNLDGIDSVFEIGNVSDLQIVEEFLKTNEKFQKQNSVGHRMYSTALEHYRSFLQEDKSFLKDFIASCNKPIPVSDKRKVVINVDPRNSVLKEHIMKTADYSCEINCSHTTFRSKSTNMNYVECHHIIPFKYQDRFNVSLDHYSNLISVCPNCHRLLHHATESVKRPILENLYQQRCDKLAKAGIILSIDEFIQLLLN